MSKSILKESPLARFCLEQRTTPAPMAAGVKVWERAFCAHINLRGDPSASDFLAAARGVLGFELPLEPNTFAGERENYALWLGPNEWLIVVPGEQEGLVAEGLRNALRGQFFAVTEVGGGQTIITLSGQNARDLLAKGCPLDLHPREFGPGHCAQSHLGKAPILIRQIDAEPTFELIARRSFADYLWCWLEDASEEYGLAVIKRRIAGPSQLLAPVRLSA